jgi:hypothetical protein
MTVLFKAAMDIIQGSHGNLYPEVRIASITVWQQPVLKLRRLKNPLHLIDR